MTGLLFCRECSEAKHVNCDGTAWDNEADAAAPCTCPAPVHHVERGRQLASEREDLIASGVDPSELEIPL